jgi:Tfp pilus assembly protein PilO
MVNLRLKHLTVRQINIVIVALTIVVTFVIVWLYVYIPVKGDFGKISSQLEAVNQRVKTIEANIPRNETTAEHVSELKQTFLELSQRVPEDEGEVLKLLTDFIRGLNMRIEFSKTGDRRLWLDDSKKAIEVDNKQCEMLPVNFRLKGTYKQLIELVAVMRESIPALIRIERVFIESSAEQADILNILLDINLYLFTKK